MNTKYIAGIVLLAAGMAIGHWIIPGTSTLDVAPPVTADLFCAEHGVDESGCTRCNPNLIPEFQATGDWCAEHGVPETQCALCNPDVAAAGVAPPSQFADPHAGHDHEPGEEHTETAVTGDEPYPGLSIVYRSNQPECPTDESIITFASSQTAERAGIEVRPVITATVHDHFEAPAEVVFDQNATSVLSSSLPISVVRWLAEPGDEVQPGDALAIVESPDMAMLQGEYLEAWSDWLVHKRERERAADMVSRGLIDSASYERSSGDATGSRARWVQSESRLYLAGVSPEDLDKLRASGEVRSRFTLHGALRRTAGEVIWISSFLDPRTRTATVRVKPVQAGSLRAHEFGRLRLPVGPAEPSILVPRDAVQWEGCCNVVFVQEAADRFRPRKVEIAAADAAYYRVISGLQPDDQVVVAGSFLLKTELKKSSIGAGCCGLEAS